jgi:sugar (glycoside-pentoside-hexuronide) transporter
MDFHACFRFVCPWSEATPAMKPPLRGVPLSRWTKSVYALGDLSSNTILSTLSLVFTSYFLVEVAGLRPVLAGLVPLVGRIVDAITDPLMGRISDHTRWRIGRRRPYFLIGALPLGVFFALIWANPAGLGEWGKLAYYIVVYCSLMCAMTVVSVPYLALQPEMALDYDERTSLNAFRSVGSVFGIIVALGLRPLAEYFGGGETGFRMAGMLLGGSLVVPWLLVYAVSFERADFARRVSEFSFLPALRACWRQRAFRRLVALYLAGRVAIDLTGVMLVLYFTHWLGRSRDFEITMLVFLLSSAAALPVWLAVARRVNKATAFTIGACWWMVGQIGMLFVEPEWPRWILFGFAPVVAAGYAAVDLMPWAMLGEVVDEDELTTDERREGVYNGLFTFLRKLAGAVAVFAALGILDLSGLAAGAPASETTRWAVRILATLAPAACLVVAVAFARGYPLTRARHEAVVAELLLLETRRNAGGNRA